MLVLTEGVPPVLADACAEECSGPSLNPVVDLLRQLSQERCSRLSPAPCCGPLWADVPAEGLRWPRWRVLLWNGHGPSVRLLVGLGPQTGEGRVGPEQDFGWSWLSSYWIISFANNKCQQAGDPCQTPPPGCKCSLCLPLPFTKTTSAPGR
jgi:hypothetical protein